MEPTYFFYDLETSGLNKAFDQIIQFAAIRTDTSLDELSRHEFKVQLKKETLPSPNAFLTHQILLKELKEGLTEYEGTKKIHEWINQPGTISLGYNTLKFDDEFLRFSFYRNLLPPYTHQYANQCRRMDLYPMTVLYYLFKPECLQWPIVDGKVSLKLEHLNIENQWVDGQAHDAMVDVKATLALATQLKKEIEMWNYASAYFEKNIDQTRLNLIGKFKKGLYIEGSIGSEHAFQCPVLYLGKHYHYKNQVLLLRLDQMNLQKTTLDTIEENTWVIRKKLAESGFVLPYNNRFLKHLSADRKKCVEANEKWLLNNTDILNSIRDYYLDYTYPAIPEIDVAASLYQNGFMNPQDEMVCMKFHEADMTEKINLINQFQNQTTRELAIRLLGEYFYQELPDELQNHFRNYLNDIYQNKIRKVDYQNKPFHTLEEIQSEIMNLRKSPCNSKQIAILDELETYFLNASKKHFS